MSTTAVHFTTAFLAAITALAMGATSTLAAKFPKMSLEEMIQNSALVCRATAIAVDPNAFDVATQSPFTRVLFQIEETLVGDWTEPTLEFYLRGGLRPNGHLQVWEGLPTFT